MFHLMVDNAEVCQDIDIEIEIIWLFLLQWNHSM